MPIKSQIKSLVSNVPFLRCLSQMNSFASPTAAVMMTATVNVVKRFKRPTRRLLQMMCSSPSCPVYSKIFLIMILFFCLFVIYFFHHVFLC